MTILCNLWVSSRNIGALCRASSPFSPGCQSSFGVSGDPSFLTNHLPSYIHLPFKPPVGDRVDAKYESYSQRRDLIDLDLLVWSSLGLEFAASVNFLLSLPHITIFSLLAPLTKHFTHTNGDLVPLRLLFRC